MELTEEIPGISSPDAIINGKKVDFKSLSSGNNILRHAKDAIKKQGAKEVWFEFTSITNKTKIIEDLKRLSLRGIHGRYYFLGENILYTF